MFETFIFDGISCDEYGITCVSFEPARSMTAPAQITGLETEKSVLGDVYHILAQPYTEPLSFTIQIANRDFSPIEPYQERALKKWLCRKGRYKLFTIYDKRYADTWFYANLSNPQTIFISEVYGMEFTVTTNAPFGFSNIRIQSHTFTENDSIHFYVDHDEDLPIYPDLTFTALQSGSYVIANRTDARTGMHPFTVNHIKAGETIHIKGAYPLIESSDRLHDASIYNDTNKEWLYLIDGRNTIQCNLPCEMKLQYREYRKVGIS
ncbi:MAG: hypothetical protein HFE84_05985 [Lachnospiraceae bacterium]|nr:hypothetical protein [Lachnospiraceae bacterium]